MEAIRRIVSEIVFMCRSRGVQVNDTLGAFMARAIVLENADLFPLEKELNESDVQELIRLSTERLIERDSPSLETVKMQVAFDTARVHETEKFERVRMEKEASEGTLIGEISAARLKPNDDVEALTALYRKIFNFLVSKAGIVPGSNRPAEREIAAALESVFPRIGLKAFTALSLEDKSAQLMELANIVLGIRLFNRHIGKGGAAIADRPREATDMVYDMISLVGEELTAVQTLCDQYGEVIANKYRSSPERPVRLQEELTNRRQYVAYLRQIDEGLRQASDHIGQLTRMLLQEMETLQDLVGSRTSVPKELVYPRFDSLAKLWASFDEEIALLEARKGTLAALRQFRDSYTSNLRAEEVVASRIATRNGSADSRTLPEDAKAAARALAAGGGSDGGGTQEAAVLLSEEECASAHLELDGFCPVTIAERNGLLLPASRTHLVRHRDRVYGFVDEASRTAFIASPDAYVKSVLASVKRAPELIHMLKLQEYFPAASIAEIMRQHVQATAGGSSLLSPMRMMQDGAMQTVDHPADVEDEKAGGYKDPNYEWNEWALRRRALQLANLRNKKTTSSQTNASALRREQETQVYLPKEGSTMTPVSTGTSVPVSKSYIAGLRGGTESRVEMVNLTYDMDTSIGKYR